MRELLSLLAFVLITINSWAETLLRGFVYDDNKEPMIGATVQLKGTNMAAIVGLDGSFVIPKVPAGEYELIVSFIGFKTFTQKIVVTGSNPLRLSVTLEPDVQTLGEIFVTGSALRGSDSQARLIERNADNTLNVVSTKSIELSPDITVANVVRRVSGLTVEMNESGDAQYAIVRGMDKRYSYTLVNGVKIPSPSNKNRYVPLDIFPAQMLERLEVSKTPTADMEGDAIGGAVNMIMKNAPEEFEFNADFQTGYNAINMIRGFYSYDRSTEDRLSPAQRFGARYEATPEDFSTDNLILTNINPLPDMLGGFTIGDRFLGKKLGVMVGGSVQNSYRGANIDWYKYDIDPLGTGRPALGTFQNRQTSTQQFRLGGHSKIDYRFNRRHSLNLYLGHFVLNDFQSREMRDITRDANEENQSATYIYRTRVRSTYSNIQNATLQGKHSFIGDDLLVDWSLVYSMANFERPDNAIFVRNGELRGGVELPQNIERRNPRRWETNYDRDYSAYLNFTYNPSFLPYNTGIRFGGMYRDKDRGTLFNRYRFDPSPALQIQFEDWEDFSDVTWDLLNPRGTLSHALNYDAYERISGYYLSTHSKPGNVEFNVGARLEHTRQGYQTRFENRFEIPSVDQDYIDILPTASLKYKLRKDMNLRAGYYKAINRPGYFELVDGVSDEDDEFPVAGNPNLRRAIADNVDLRFELFPKSNEQLLVGAFYKRIEDPIETLLVRSLSVTSGERRLTPVNSGTATNMGIEVDFSKFFNKIGIRGNYTYTNSSMTTSKVNRVRENPADPTSDLILIEVEQTRPLSGQADHIANLSLIYKNQMSGTDVQVSGVFVGERIEFISPFVDLDLWSRPMFQLDFSFEQNVSKNWIVFFKANNILNTRQEFFVKKPRKTEESIFPLQDRDDVTTIQISNFWQSFRVGVRMKINSI